MILAKLIFIYTVLGVFVAISATGILAAWGVIQLPATTIASAFIAPCLGIVATMIQAKHIFDDPEAVKKLKEEQFDAELTTKRTAEERIAEAVTRERTAATQQHQRDQQALSILQTDNQKVTADLKKSQAEVVRQQQLVSIHKPKPPGPVAGV